MTSTKIARLQERVKQLLQANGIRKAPVDVEQVARHLGLLIRRTPGNDDLSGFFLRQGDGKSIIGVNTVHHPNRQRFTIAHEIGHFLFHNFGDVHVDQSVFKERNKNSTTGEDRQEIEANRFAAELLMPESFLRQDLRNFGVHDLHDDRALRQLAKSYQVSVQAMTTRLITWGYS
jgi:Zn-dependent peptidase ImmA (M78 family)